MQVIPAARRRSNKPVTPPTLLTAEQDLLVREFRPSDAGALTLLLHAAYAELGQAGWNFTAIDQDEGTTLAEATAGHCWVVIDTNGRLVATLTMTSPPDPGIQELSSMARAPKRAWLTQVAVSPALHGQRITSQLWRIGAAWASEVGADTIGLDVASKALHLVEIFQQWGFIAGEVVQRPSKTYRSVVMLHDPGR